MFLLGFAAARWRPRLIVDPRFYVFFDSGSVHEAVVAGDPDAVDAALRRVGGLVHVVDREGNTPLAWAAFAPIGRDVNVAKKLVEAKHSVRLPVPTEVPKNNGLLPAVENGRAELARYLFSVGANWAAGECPFIIATQRPAAGPMIRVLIDAGLRPRDVRGEHGQPPRAIEQAVRNDDVEAFRLLAGLGLTVEPPVAGQARLDLLTTAVNANAAGMIEVLVREHGFDPNQNYKGTTMLEHIAGNDIWLPAVERLLAVGGDPTRPAGPLGQTAAEVADSKRDAQKVNAAFKRWSATKPVASKITQ